MNLSSPGSVYISETGFYIDQGGDDMDEFEKLLEAQRLAVERYVRFRIGTKTDADDVLQEIFFSAYRKFPQLKSTLSFKPWILSIARNKCNDFFRRKASQLEIPIDELTEQELSFSRCGPSEVPTVRETLSLLGDKDKQILYLYFWKELPQAEIAKLLKIPVGTVKSRLYTAKQNFKNKYPYRTGVSKGESNMKTLPEFIPEYKIEASTELPFQAKWEELMGWFLVPKLGEKLSWGMYDIPSRKCSHIYDMHVTGKAKVHGIEGVELIAREAAYSNRKDTKERTFVAQLTDSHCRYLAAVRTDDGIRRYITFLDTDEFMPIWGFGEDNCGNETQLRVKGIIQRKGNSIQAPEQANVFDVVGRYTVSILGKKFDTVCAMFIEGKIAVEQYIDQNGKTILWRRFNRNDWAIDRYRRTWVDQLPKNERLTINGETYVHWYDCITDYIL